MATTNKLPRIAPRTLELLRAAKVFNRYELAVRNALFLQGRDYQVRAGHEQGLLLAGFKAGTSVAEVVLAITFSRDTSTLD